MIEFTAPIKIVSESNRSVGRHWAVVRRRFRSHARDIALCLKNAETKANDRIWNWPMGASRIVVTLTRIAPRRLDSHDNLRSGFKGAADQIAHELVIDDGDSRIEWRYAQERGKPREYAVRIRIERIAMETA